jgi:hypothetical protein
VKAREILESIRATPVRGDRTEAFGNVRARVTPTEFLSDPIRNVVQHDHGIDWASKIQAERDAQRLAEKERAEEAAEAAEADSQPVRKTGNVDKVKRGAPKPRITRSRKPAGS